MPLPYGPTQSFSAIPEDYLFYFRRSLLRIMTSCTTELSEGKTFLGSEAIKQAVIDSAEHHAPLIPPVTILNTYRGLSRIGLGYYRDAMLYVSKREYFCTASDRTIWHNEDFYSHYIANRPSRSAGDPYGACKEYDQRFLIDIPAAKEGRSDG